MSAEFPCESTSDTGMFVSQMSCYKETLERVLRFPFQVMIEVGELFCEQSGCSSDLEASAEEQCLRYLHSYHGQSLATLKTYLEHESWELMPVRDGFSLDNLHEFCFLNASRTAAKNERTSSCSSSPLKTLPEGEISFSPDARDPFIVEALVQSRFVRLSQMGHFLY